MISTCILDLTRARSKKGRGRNDNCIRLSSYARRHNDRRMRHPYWVSPLLRTTYNHLWAVYRLLTYELYQ